MREARSPEVAAEKAPPVSASSGCGSWVLAGAGFTSGASDILLREKNGNMDPMDNKGGPGRTAWRPAPATALHARQGNKAAIFTGFGKQAAAWRCAKPWGWSGTRLCQTGWHAAALQGRRRSREQPPLSIYKGQEPKSTPRHEQESPADRTSRPACRAWRLTQRSLPSVAMRR